MKRLLRILVRSVVVAGVGVALGALARGIVGRVSGQPGTPDSAGSFDTWPPVPPAPPRPASDT